MKSANHKILVKVDTHQKDTMKIGDSVVSTALKYEVNHRYKSPTICEVVAGNKYLLNGDVLLVHHNLFPENSPHKVDEGLYSIPVSTPVIFAKIDKEGNIDPVCGNVIVEEFEEEYAIGLPPEMRKLHKNAYKVLLPGDTPYKKGQIILTRPSSGYQIVYHWNQEQRISVKVNSDMICGVVKK